MDDTARRRFAFRAQLVARVGNVRGVNLLVLRGNQWVTVGSAQMHKDEAWALAELLENADPTNSSDHLDGRRGE